jgi:hypothetical protein
MMKALGLPPAAVDAAALRAAIVNICIASSAVVRDAFARPRAAATVLMNGGAPAARSA